MIRAPFNGAIVSTSLREESSARIGSVLGEIINLENLELQVPVPASEIAWIDRSKSVKLSAEGFPGSWTGTIARIGSNVEQRTQTVPVFITVHGDIDRLYEGLYIRAEIPGRAVASGALVPRRAVYEERFVYIVEDGTLQRRDITIGRRNPETVIVTAGLSSGDTLVTELLQGVSDGMPAAALLRRTKETAERGSGSVE